MKKIILLIILLSFAITSGCNSPATTGVTPVPPEKDTLKIGVVYPQTGEDQVYGTFLGNGYKLAETEINEKGGIRGKKIELVIKDDFSTAKTAEKVTKELAEDDKMLCILGSYSSATTYPMSKICRDSKIPLITATASLNEITTEGNEWVFRICAPVIYDTNPLMDFIIEYENPKTIAVLHTDTILSKRINEQLEDYACKKGMKIVITESYRKGMIDFRAILKRIREKKPDLLYMTASAEDAPLIMLQAKEVDLNPKIYAGSGTGFIEPELLEEAKEAAEYLILIAQWHKNADYPGTQKFVKKYKEKFGKEPTYHAVFAYTGLMALANALNHSETEKREDIRKALKETNMYSITGLIRFEDYDGYTNQNKYQAVIMQIQKGKFVPLYPPEVKNGEVILPVPPWSER